MTPQPSESMLALSVRQPWASLMFISATESGTPIKPKDIENRDWPTRVRGRVLIHAAKGCTRDEWDDAIAFSEGVLGRSITTPFKDAKRGGIIGSVEIADCVTASASPWFVGRYGFVLRNPKTIPFVPMRGQLGFFRVPTSLVSEATSSRPILFKRKGRAATGQPVQLWDVVDE